MLLNIKVLEHCKTQFLLEIFPIKVYLKIYFAKTKCLCQGTGHAPEAILLISNPEPVYSYANLHTKFG